MGVVGEKDVSAAESLARKVGDIIRSERERSELYLISLREQVQSAERQLGSLVRQVAEVEQVLKSDLWKSLVERTRG